MKIEGRDLTVRYGAREALSSVWLTLQPGAMVGLIGPNGAGKTTLIRALAGLTPLAGGDLLYDGALAGKMPRETRARKIAYLAQSGSAEWPLQVEAIVALGRLPHRRAFSAPTEFDAAAVERALAAAELVPLRSRTLGELSGGERARVLIARALAVEADWLLADEPVAALDPLHQLRAMALLRGEVARGASVVVVLHDLTLAVRFCDRLVVLRDGRVALDGPPDALTGQVIAEVYGVEVLRGTHRGEAFVLPWAAID